MTHDLPLTITLSDRRCVCVGGGAVVARRIPAVLAAGALVHVIAPTLDSGLAGRVADGSCTHEARTFATGDTAGAFFVLAATGHAAVDSAVARDAESHGCLVCIASDPRLGNCQFMATVRRGALLVALQSGAAAPAVTAALRARVERLLPEDLGTSLDALAVMRRTLRASVPDAAERASRWEQAVESGAIEALLDGAGAGALERIRRILLTSS